MVQANNVAAAQAKTFAPSKAHLKMLEAALAPAHSDTDKHLSADQVAEGVELDAYFTCTICIQVVESPKECLQCSQLCCGHCLTQWGQRDNSCPNCRSPINLGKSVNRFVLQALNATKFKCDSCDVIFNYENRLEHWNACG